MAGNASVVIDERDFRQSEHAPHQHLDRAHDRTKNPHEEQHQGRNQQRHAIGIGDGDRLGHHFTENDNERGHDCGRGPHATLAKDLEQDTRGDRRRADGDQLSPEQHRADETSAHADQAGDEFRPRVAARFQRMHPRSGRRGQGGLGASEERCGGNAQDDDHNVEGVRHGAILARAHPRVMRSAFRPKRPVRAPGKLRRLLRPRHGRRNSRRCLWRG